MSLIKYMNEQTFKISGFHCEACVKLSTMKIRKISGVEDVLVTQDGTTKVNAIRAIASDEIAEALAGLGYTVVAT